jgi:hypothetical protein
MRGYHSVEQVHSVLKQNLTARNYCKDVQRISCSGLREFLVHELSHALKIQPFHGLFSSSPLQTIHAPHQPQHLAFSLFDSHILSTACTMRKHANRQLVGPKHLFARMQLSCVVR